MISRDELLSIPATVRRLREEETRIKIMRSKLYSPHGYDSSEKVHCSPGSQTALADIVIDMEQKLDAKKTELERLQTEAEALILGTDLDGDATILMLLRYTEGASWHQITETIHYSPAAAYRAHKAALDTLFEK